MKYRLKNTEVFARQAEREMTVLHFIKGEQHAKKGDWLIGNERGRIEVVKPAAFEAQYEPIPEAVDCFPDAEEKK